MLKFNVPNPFDSSQSVKFSKFKNFDVAIPGGMLIPARAKALETFVSSRLEGMQALSDQLVDSGVQGPVKIATMGAIGSGKSTVLKNVLQNQLIAGNAPSDGDDVSMVDVDGLIQKGVNRSDDYKADLGGSSFHHEAKRVEKAVRPALAERADDLQVMVEEKTNRNEMDLKFLSDEKAGRPLNLVITDVTPNTAQARVGSRHTRQDQQGVYTASSKEINESLSGVRSNSVEVVSRALKGEISGVRLFNNDGPEAVEVLSVSKDAQGQIVVKQQGTDAQLRQALTTFDLSKDGTIDEGSVTLSSDAQSVLDTIGAQKKIA